MKLQHTSFEKYGGEIASTKNTTRLIKAMAEDRVTAWTALAFEMVIIQKKIRTSQAAVGHSHLRALALILRISAELKRELGKSNYCIQNGAAKTVSWIIQTYLHSERSIRIWDLIY